MADADVRDWLSVWALLCAAWPTALRAPDQAAMDALRGVLGARWREDYGALAYALAQSLPVVESSRPPVLALAGAQGTGKSTLAAHLQAVLAQRDERAAVLGLDDLYRTRSERVALASSTHPLLRTRGVPGTHDLRLGMRLLDALLGADDTEVLLPQFDKSVDDRQPVTRWHRQPLPVALVIVEGWCLGLPPQHAEELDTAINALEASEDADGRWRRWVNMQLEREYAALFARFDALLVLLPPDFDAVLRWRTEQEQALPATRRMTAAALRRFVAHYERLTRHGLSRWPERADWQVQLDARHRIERVLVRRG